LTAEVDFNEPDDRALRGSEKISNLENPVNNITKDVEVRAIGISGDYRFTLSLQSEKEYLLNRDLITFRAIAQETMLGWVIGTVLAIAVLVVGIWNLVLLATQ